MKAEFMQLAHKYDPNKHMVAGWYLSEKLDGVRAFWDGGITRGMKVKDVPWANVEKDARLREEPISTGLWSRYGKVIHAPDFWLDYLPNIPLDGELFINRGSWQKLSSIVKRFDKSVKWGSVKFMILDSPPFDIIFADRIINTTNYKKQFNGIIPWLKDNYAYMFRTISTFEFTYQRLIKANLNNKICEVHEQKQIPIQKYNEFIESELNKVLEKGGEGIIIKNPYAHYRCERSHNVLKYKPFNDDEGTVVGYIWGKETELGSKLLGLMGSLILNYNGKIFELSGFTDAEREMTYVLTGYSAKSEGENYSGEKVSENIHNAKFPIGSKVTFRYRELSDRGVPKECRYLRAFI